ncbi:hypothetical protein T492DRAFT_846789 [Pavlovales sp. CCMP2436]|nr:hypothetical protein T492DRAFT_846789 [Pavlovales sp. CCMP2436]
MTSGGVLASLLPLPAAFGELASLDTIYGNNILYHFEMQRLYAWREGPKTSRAEFLRSARWTGADIDIFFWGLDKDAARLKFDAIMRKMRRYDLLFVKTPNTVITRLYALKEDILNTFDIDVCGFAFDGARVLAVLLALAALRTKVNQIDLTIRDEAYESRLLKYAERGFAIGVPQLQRCKVARDNLKLELGIGWYGGEEESPTSASYEKYQNAHYLERLLLVESWATQIRGILELRLFQSCQSKLNVAATEHSPRAAFYLNGVSDAYSPITTASTEQINNG